MSDKKLEDMVEISECRFEQSIWGEYENLIRKQQELLSAIKERDFYRHNNYIIRYWYNKKHNQYLFDITKREPIGFKYKHKDDKNDR